MSIELSTESLRIVEEQIALGNYATPGDVIASALVDLRRRHEEFARIKSAVDQSIAQADRGQTNVFSAERIKALGRQELANRRVER